MAHGRQDYPMVLKRLKVGVRQLQKNAKACAKLEVTELKRTKIAKKKGCFEVAKTHSENAKKQKTQSYNYLRTSSYLDYVVCKLEDALQRDKDEFIFDVMRTIDEVLNTNDLAKIFRVVRGCEEIMEGMARSSPLDKVPDRTPTILLQSMIDKEDLTLQLLHTPSFISEYDNSNSNDRLQKVDK
ncbi:charged multivesicular body protein 1b-2-like [Cimex lectularius]|uniref:Uncharacterized protein n=1 Tax=Cimex lectularius TaxID=79782 RepID=A0A8I6TC62_CIMLE|nr:charged multivesicular body protein 1b-2-like [Cimex lectularius]